MVRQIIFPNAAEKVKEVLVNDLEAGIYFVRVHSTTGDGQIRIVKAQR